MKAGANVKGFRGIENYSSENSLIISGAESLSFQTMGFAVPPLVFALTAAGFSLLTVSSALLTTWFSLLPVSFALLTTWFAFP